MPHVQKYTQTQVALIMAHNLRAKSTSYRSADERYEKENKYYVYNGERLAEVRADNKKILDIAYKRQKKLFKELPHAKRKDLVTLAEWVITCPKDILPNDRVRFLEASMDYVAERYGVESITCAAIHLDEPNAMPHLHITFVPVDGKGRICARNVLTRRELQHFHPELEQYVSKKLGYEVHILREPEERTKVSKPLSQYKAETMRQEAKAKMDNALEHEEAAKESERSARLIRDEAVKKEQEAQKTLKKAESTLFDARASARAAAANRTKEYQSKGFWDWLGGKKDPVEYVRSVSTELETVAAIDKQQAKEHEAAVLAREQAVTGKEQRVIARSKELDEWEKRLEAKEKEFAAEREAAEKAAKEEAERIRQEQEQRENKLRQQLLDIQEAEKQAAQDKQDAAEFRAEAAEAKEEAEKQYVEARILSDEAKAAIKRWYADKAKWVSVEEANERYQDEKHRGDIYEQSSEDYRKRYQSEKTRANKAEQTVKQQAEQIISHAAEVMSKDKQIKDLQLQIKKEQAKSGSLETTLADNVEYATMLRAELRYKNGLLPVRPQTDTKAKLIAYQEQSDQARQKTNFSAKLETIEPSLQRVAEAKTQLLTKGAHHHSTKKLTSSSDGR